ncbi:MAG TPA: GGDEF domain-containing protein [Burkholderiales bacterium]|nr:GGDEF domain-containing protein [Burkholderiales bacterium]
MAEIGNERLRLVLDHVPALIAYVDASETYQFANRAYETLFGLAPEQMIGRTMREVLGEKYPEAKPHIDAALAGRRTMHDRMVTANRRSHYLHNVYVPHLGDDGRVAGLFILAIDVSDRKALEQDLAHKAHHDPLTGLPNRALFEDCLQQALERAARAASGVALMFLDIDNFKRINDTLGHPAGDEVLKTFAARIKKCVRSTDVVSRLSGDEFVVLLENVADAETAMSVARKLVAAMREEIMLGRDTVTATTSVGVAHSGGRAAIGARELIARADAAMYQAKAAGRNRFHLA